MPVDIKKHMQLCKDILHSNLMDEFNRIRFMGGEIFDKSMDILNAEDDFFELVNICIDYLKSGKLTKVSFLTNLIYSDRKHLEKTIHLFEKEGLLDKLSIDTSYDYAGRFTPEKEKVWWDNMIWLNTNYPMLKVHIGMIMTQALITGATKEWLDNFSKRLCNFQITFNELDTGAEMEFNKDDRSYHNLFPCRSDFLKFLKNLKDWGYFNLIGFVEASDSNLFEDMPAVEILFTQRPGLYVLKDLSCLLTSRERTREDGYVDSSVPLYSDVKKYTNIKD